MIIIIQQYKLNHDSIAEGINHFLKLHLADCIAMYTRHRSILKSIYSKSITKNLSLNTTILLMVVHENNL